MRNRSNDILIALNDAKVNFIVGATGAESFRKRNVVCRPEEALDCFLRTRMDVLVLGTFYLERKTAEVQRYESAKVGKL